VLGFHYPRKKERKKENLKKERKERSRISWGSIILNAPGVSCMVVVIVQKQAN